MTTTPHYYPQQQQQPPAVQKQPTTIMNQDAVAVPFPLAVEEEIVVPSSAPIQTTAPAPSTKASSSSGRQKPTSGTSSTKKRRTDLAPVAHVGATCVKMHFIFYPLKSLFFSRKYHKLLTIRKFFIYNFIKNCIRFKSRQKESIQNEMLMK